MVFHGFLSIMKGYYLETAEEIETLIKEKKIQEAKAILDRELGMPYIPADAEKKFRQLKRDVDYLLSENKGVQRISDDALLDDLHGNAEAQMRAASSLYKSNLRSFIPELQEYLQNEPYPDAAALLIEGIAEQEIGEEFVFNRNGVEYTFWGDAIEPVEKSSGFLKAMRLLEEWIGTKHPDMYAMSKTLLIHKAFLFLPLSYDEDEGEQLALDVLREISSLMDDGELYQEVIDWRNHLA